jgi:ribonuclease HI
LLDSENAKEQSTENILKGKMVVLDVACKPSSAVCQLKLPMQPWKPPDSEWVKLTIDGSFKTEDGGAGSGMILRDSNGNIIFSACRNLLMCNNALEAEGQACLEGLELALQYSQLPIIVDTDCVQLVAMVSDSSPDRSSLVHLISEIKRLSSQSRSCKFVKVDR